jgi:simple sugar transport system ATP-binding protein
MHALRDITLEAYQGEVVALLGDNGAGKSTLVRLLSGAERPDRGEIRLDGEGVRLTGPADGRRRGIEVAWQDLALARSLDATGNLFLGREVVRKLPLPTMFCPLRKKTMAREAKRILGPLQPQWPLSGLIVEKFSGGQRQQLSFARTAAWSSRLVLMDEPTAALSVMQRKRVWDWCRTVADDGVAVIAIGHAIDELLAIADRVIIFRHGQKVLDRRAAGLSMTEVVQSMAGLAGMEDDGR